MKTAISNYSGKCGLHFSRQASIFFCLLQLASNGLHSSVFEGSPFLYIVENIWVSHCIAGSFRAKNMYINSRPQKWRARSSGDLKNRMKKKKRFQPTFLHIFMVS